MSDIWKITEEKIVAMLSDSPRRLRLCDISAKFKEWPSPLRRRGDSHTLRFPFYNTYIPALSNWRRYLKDRGWRMWNQEEFFENNRHHIDLKNASPEDLQLIQVWLTMISTKLCIKDCLACTIALDYTNMEGDPAKAPTEVSILRTRAKLYGPQDEPGDDTIEAANDLAKLCIDLIATSHAFYGIDSVELSHAQIHARNTVFLPTSQVWLLTTSGLTTSHSPLHRCKREGRQKIPP